MWIQSTPPLDVPCTNRFSEKIPRLMHETGCMMGERPTKNPELEGLKRPCFWMDFYVFFWEGLGLGEMCPLLGGGFNSFFVLNKFYPEKFEER